MHLQAEPGFVQPGFVQPGWLARRVHILTRRGKREWDHRGEGGRVDHSGAGSCLPGSLAAL